jgi:hypothetical protein
MQALVVSYGEFHYACIVEICHQSNELVFNHLLHFFIVTHVHAAQKLLQVCVQVKITWSQVQTVGRMGKNIPGKMQAQVEVLCTSSLYLLEDPRI